MELKKKRIIFIEDDKVDQVAFERFAQSEDFPYDYKMVGSIEEAKMILDKEDFDAVVIDYLLGEGTALELFDHIKDIPIIIATSAGDEVTAVKAMKAGAHDYLIKDSKGTYLKTLPMVVENAIESNLNNEKLRKSEARYRNLIEFANVGIIVSENSKILRVNKKAEEIYGYSQEELIGQSPSILTPEECSHKHKETMSNMLKLGKVEKMVFEEEGIKKDGSLFPLEISFALTDPVKKNVISVMRDITERKKSERDVKEARDFFKSLFDTSAEGIIICDSQGKISMVNKALEKMLDYPQEELIGNRLGRFISNEKESKEKNRIMQKKLVEEGIVTEYEHTWTRKDGSTIDVEINVVSLKDDENKATGAIATVRDVTSRKRAERELRETKDYLDNIIDSSLDCIIVSDYLGSIIRANKSFTKLIGREEKEILGKHTRELSPTEERYYESSVGELVKIDKEYFDNTIAMIGRLYEEGKLTDWENYYLTKDGIVVPVESNITFIYNDKGDVTSSIGISRDITERKKAEHELKTSEEKYRGIVEHANDAIFTMNGKGNIIELNKKAEELFGYSRDEIVGKPAFLLSPPDVREQREKKFAQFKEALKKGPFKGVREGRGMRKDGKIIFIESSMFSSKENGEHTFISFIRDITERKLDEEILKKSEESYYNLIMFANAGIISAKGGRITRVNKKAEEIYGYSKEELIGQPLDILTPEKYKKRHRELFNKVVVSEKMKMVVFEEEGIRKDGSLVHIEISFTFTLEEEIMTTAIIRDISERKQAENKLRKAYEELEETNKDLKDFSYVVSHDLKAPLRAISQLADWVSQDYAPLLDAKGKKQMCLLIGRTKRMYNLIEGILHYSQLGRFKEKAEPVNLNPLVESVIATIAPPHTVQVTIDNTLPVITGDKTRFEQLFQNLLSNAVKFMDKPQGEVKVGCADEGSHWKFTITDNGPGIDEKYHEKIFQIFQTLKPRDEFESTGIGLTLVKKIVERNGGKIWIESSKGKGSTFFFTLPKKGEECNEEQKAYSAG